MDANYRNFDLHIERIGQSYQAKVIDSPAGQAEVLFDNPFTQHELDQLGYAPHLGAQKLADVAQTFGTRLFYTIFHDTVRDCLVKSMERTTHLRIRLHLNHVPELALWPWEYLYNPSQERFFALSERTSVVRYLDLPQREKALAIHRPLRILAVLSSPKSIAPLDIEHEWQRLQEALSDLRIQGQVVVERLPAATFAALQQRLRQGDVHILHFVGHGAFDPENQEGLLVFEDEERGIDSVKADALGTLLHDHEALRLVFLNTCEGALSGTNDPFNGTAQKLMQQGIPAVIAMQFLVSDLASTRLAYTFYQAIADGYPVDGAVAEARKAIYAQNNSAEWATPVLFMRADDGQLFEIEESDKTALEPTPGDSPYKGLAYFDIEDSELFFGRETLTNELVEHFATNSAKRFLAVVGASGSGKSSLVRAGLIPALKRGQDPTGSARPPAGSEQWPLHMITPTDRPLESLAASLTRDQESMTATATLLDDMRQDPRSLHLYARKLLAVRGMDPRQKNPRLQQASIQSTQSNRLILVVDQFEELFTLCHDKQERLAFIQNLLTASTPFAPADSDIQPIEDGPTLVIITLRADFYANCSEFDELRQALNAYQYYIGPMNRDDLRCAIEEPAHRNGWELEPGLVDLLLTDIGHEPGALPLLSHALFETWRRRRGHQLTFSGYADAGRVQGAIAHTAEAIYADLETEEQVAARHIFLNLTELGEGTPDTRRRVKQVELMPNAQTEQTRSLLKTLADARLITLSEKGVEVAHEALIREWNRLRQWLDEDREGLRTHRRLGEAAQEWAELEYDADALYQGTRLDRASEWMAAHSDLLNALERTFLEKSMAEAEAEEQAKEAAYQRELAQERALAREAEARASDQTKARRRFQGLAIVLAKLFVIALVIAGFAIVQQDLAIERRDQTLINESHLLTNLALQQLTVDPVASLHLSLMALPSESAPRPYIPEAEFALIQSVRASLERKHIPIAEAPLTEHDFAVNPETGQIAIADDGLSLTTDAFHTDWRGCVGEPAVDGGEERADTCIQQIDDGPINGLAWSRENLLLSFDENSVGVWKREALIATTSHAFDEPLSCATWRPHHPQVAICSGSTIWLWSYQDNSLQELYRLTKEASHVDGYWSPDGLHLIVTAPSRSAYILSIEANRQAVVTEIGSGIEDVAFIDQTQFLTWGYDGRVVQWQVNGEPGALEVADMAGFKAFPDQGHLLAFADNGEGHLWPLDEAGWPTLLMGHEKRIRSAAWHPAGDYIATGGTDGTVRIWDAAYGMEIMTLYGHTAKTGGLQRPDVLAVDWLDDGIHLRSIGRDGTIRIWQIFNGRGRPLCYGTDRDGYPRCYDADLPFYAHASEIDFAHWVDAETVVTVDVDGVAQQISLATDEWSMPSAELLADFERLARTEGSVASSPDERYEIAIEHEQFTIRDRANAEILWQNVAHREPIEGIAWLTGIRWQNQGINGSLLSKLRRSKHSNGAARLLLLTWSGDGTTRLWDVEGQTELMRMSDIDPSSPSAPNPINIATVNTDSNHILTAGYNRVLNIWYSWHQSAESLVETAQDGITRELSEAQKKQFSLTTSISN